MRGLHACSVRFNWAKICRWEKGRMNHWRIDYVDKVTYESLIQDTGSTLPLYSSYISLLEHTWNNWFLLKLVSALISILRVLWKSSKHRGFKNLWTVSSSSSTCSDCVYLNFSLPLNILMNKKGFKKCFLSNNKKVSTNVFWGIFENSATTKKFQPLLRRERIVDWTEQAFNVNPSMVVIVLMFIQSIHGCNCCPTFYGRAGFAPSATSLGLFPLAILSTQSYHQHLFHLFHSLSPSHSCCQA